MAKSIMIQGTTSNAGKSLLVTALCRILAQDGYRVAPFKSQNMALNSFVTNEGLEMGRAQVAQAEAAGVEPSVLMNPILLKPTGDTGSQVIVRGEVVGDMEAAAYYDYKQTLRPVIQECYDELDSRSDIVVLEGAGSPAEINLKANDIVNMGMAKMASAPVLLAGDIDLGGVFASLYGTIALLDPDERPYVKGTLINKFRGDVSLLEPGLVQLAALTGVPTLGVVPWLDVAIDAEDSQSSDIPVSSIPNSAVDIVIIKLPHISNFTDFAPLAHYPHVSLRYVESPSQVGRPHMIVVPGTKNTMADLAWLKEHGFGNVLRASSMSGTLVMGICGGYQMLGERIADPHGVEGGGEVLGLGLLPVQTVFTGEKRRTRVIGRVGDLGTDSPFAGLSGTTFSGYEIHMGETEPLPCAASGNEPGAGAFSRLALAGDGLVPLGNGGEGSAAATGAGADAAPDGFVRGNVLGTYCHGIFEDGTFPDAFVEFMSVRANIMKRGFPKETFAAFKNRQYDELAAAVREALDMDAVMRVIEQGV
ncbi:MAG: cobyric acid synthase [Coriobacteriales bacterium]